MGFLSKKSIANLESLRKGYTDLFTNRLILRSRFELIDKYVERELDTTAAGTKAKIANQAGQRDKIGNQEIPLCFAQMDTAHAYLTGVFCTGYPIFAAVSPRQFEDQATAMTALCGRDQQTYNWTSNIMGCLQDAVKYNICAGEFTWDVKKVASISTKLVDGKRNTTKVEAEEYSGNKIKHLNMYNVIFDQTVRPELVHEEGAFIGYYESISYIQAKQLVADLDPDYAIFANTNDALTNSRGVVSESYTPTIRQDNTTYNAQDWTIFWGPESRNAVAAGAYKGTYEKLKLYCRIIPEEYGITNVSNSGTPAIFKLIWLNGTLICAEPLTNAHSYFPIILGIPMMGNLGLQTKSFTENVMSLQDNTTSLMNGTLASMRRAVSDRAIYDPTRIKPTDVNSPVPNAKIPVAMNMWSKGLEDAYKQIPYEDRASQYLMSNFQVLMSMSDLTTGLNRASSGNFVKGNKTLQEFDTIMSKSDARLQKLAINLENSFFAPGKHIIKCNYLQYAMAEQVYSEEKESVVEVDPAKLRSAILSFSMSDGTMPADKLGNTQMLIAAMNAVAQQPDIALEYDVGGMVVSMVKKGGLDLAQYKRTPEQVQQYVQTLNARNAPTAGQPTDQGGAPAGNPA